MDILEDKQNERLEFKMVQRKSRMNLLSASIHTISTLFRHGGVENELRYQQSFPFMVLRFRHATKEDKDFFEEFHINESLIDSIGSNIAKCKDVFGYINGALQTGRKKVIGLNVKKRGEICLAK